MEGLPRAILHLTTHRSEPSVKMSPPFSGKVNCDSLPFSYRAIGPWPSWERSASEKILVQRPDVQKSWGSCQGLLWIVGSVWSWWRAIQVKWRLRQGRLLHAKGRAEMLQHRSLNSVLHACWRCPKNKCPLLHQSLVCEARWEGRWGLFSVGDWGSELGPGVLTNRNRGDVGRW